MKKILLFVFVVIMAMSFVGCAGSKDDVVEVPTDVVAVVNGEKISVEEYTKNFKILEYTYSMTYGEGIWSEEFEGRPLKDVIKEELLSNLIKERIIAQIAVENEVEINEIDIDEYYLEFESAVNADENLAAFYSESGIDETFIREQIKMQLLVDEFYTLIENDIIENETLLEDTYENFKLEVRARHILLASKEDAEKTLTRLETEDFATLASEISEDPGSKISGGDLGYFARNVMVPAFEKAAYTLEIGEISEIIESDFGYHIIKVEDYHTLNRLIETGISDDEVQMFKDYIISFLSNDEFDNKIIELYEEADIQRYMENIQ